MNNIQKNIDYGSFFDTNLSIMFLLDPDTLDIIDANQSACLFYKYDYAEIIQLKMTAISILSDIALHKLLNKAIENPISILAIHKLSTGESKNVEVYSAPIMFSGKRLLHSTVYNITDALYIAKRTEDQKKIIEDQNELLKVKNKQLQSIIDNISDGLVIYNRNGKIILSNAAAAEYITLSTISNSGAEILSRCTCRDMFGNILNQEHSPVSVALKGEKLVQKRLLFDYKSEEIYLDVSVTPVFSQGKLSNIILSVRNVSQNVKYHELLLDHQKILLDAEHREKVLLEDSIKVKDEFIMLITHELRTPIMIINSSVQTMALVCGDELSDRALNYLAKIKQNSLRQLRLTTNLLEVTKFQTGHEILKTIEVDIIALTSAILDSVNTYASKKNIRVLLETNCELRVITIDDGKYERILLNLLSNAIKFSPNGKDIFVRLGFGKDLIRLEIQDEGIGIPKDKQKIIFEKFVQVDNILCRGSEGTGIGLYLVKSMVDLLGGSINLISTMGKGSSFKIELPISRNGSDVQKASLGFEAGSRIEEDISIEFSDIHFADPAKEKRRFY